MSADLRLYALVDPEHAGGYDLAELAWLLACGGATLVQLRDKHGSTRNLVIVSSAHASFSWLKQNLANDGNPAWDTNRTTKPSDVPVISPSYDVTTRC